MIVFVCSFAHVVMPDNLTPILLARTCKYAHVHLTLRRQCGHVMTCDKHMACERSSGFVGDQL
jgi:hypothetical protein